MMAVEEWLKMVFRAKLRKYLHVHAHAVTDIALNHFLSTSSLLSSLADSSSLPKTAAISPSNIITAMLKVNEGADGDNGECCVIGCL